MNPIDTPFPLTLHTFSRLSERQRAFCRGLLSGQYGSDSYRQAYSNSRHADKAASKVKNSQSAQRYLQAEAFESHSRARVQREATELARHYYGTNFNKQAWIAEKLERLRDEQAVQMEAERAGPLAKNILPLRVPAQHPAPVA